MFTCCGRGWPNSIFRLFELVSPPSCLWSGWPIRGCRTELLCAVKRMPMLGSSKLGHRSIPFTGPVWRFYAGEFNSFLTAIFQYGCLPMGRGLVGLLYIIFPKGWRGLSVLKYDCAVRLKGPGGVRSDMAGDRLINRLINPLIGWCACAAISSLGYSVIVFDTNAHNSLE